MNTMIECGSLEEIAIQQANPNHIGAIMDLYNEIHIDESNVQQKLELTGPDNFSRTGGIFDIKSHSDFNGLLVGDCFHSFIIESAANSKSLDAYYLYALDGASAFNKLNLDMSECELDLMELDDFSESLRDGTVAYIVDVIVSRRSQSRNTFHRMLQYGINKARHLGLTHSFFEIATLKCDGNEYINPSMALSKRFFDAKRIGHSIEKRSVGDRHVEIKSNYLMMKI